MTRPLGAMLCSLALVVTACTAGGVTGAGPTPAGRPASPTPPTASTVPSRSAPSAPGATKPRPADTATPTPSETPHGHAIGSSASYAQYDSLARWIDKWDAAVAIVEIVEVSEPRWDTPTGACPPEALLHGPPLDPEFPEHYNIGRLVKVRMVRMLQGESPVTAGTLEYWRPGGTVGVDSGAESPIHPAVTASDVGRRAIAQLLPRPVLLGIPPSMSVTVGDLFPADAQGRIVTPLGTDEGITLDNVESFLP